MRYAPILICVIALNTFFAETASAAQLCAWLVEHVEDDGAHMFRLNLSSDAATSVSARFQGPGFTSAAMGGDMIQLEAGEAKEIDGEGFDVSAGDDLHFDVALYDHALGSLEEMEKPSGKSLAAFVFEGKVGADEHAPAGVLARQCKPLG
jgi:hypothetical protein